MLPPTIFSNNSNQSNDINHINHINNNNFSNYVSGVVSEEEGGSDVGKEGSWRSRCDDNMFVPSNSAPSDSSHKKKKPKVTEDGNDRVMMRRLLRAQMTAMPYSTMPSNSACRPQMHPFQHQPLPPSAGSGSGNYSHGVLPYQNDGPSAISASNPRCGSPFSEALQNLHGREHRTNLNNENYHHQQVDNCSSIPQRFAPQANVEVLLHNNYGSSSEGYCDLPNIHIRIAKGTSTHIHNNHRNFPSMTPAYRHDKQDEFREVNRKRGPDMGNNFQMQNDGEFNFVDSINDPFTGGVDEHGNYVYHSTSPIQHNEGHSNLYGNPTLFNSIQNGSAQQSSYYHQGSIDEIASSRSQNECPLTSTNIIRDDLKENRDDSDFFKDENKEKSVRLEPVDAESASIILLIYQQQIQIKLFIDVIKDTVTSLLERIEQSKELCKVIMTKELGDEDKIRACRSFLISVKSSYVGANKVISSIKEYNSIIQKHSNLLKSNAPDSDEGNELVEKLKRKAFELVTGIKTLERRSDQVRKYATHMRKENARLPK